MKFSLIEIIITFFLINYINCQIDITKENEIKAFISLNKEEKLTTEKKFEISENPKISIIIPIYNNEQSITSTIRSIQNQNLLDIEIVCINDHSNDTSLKILKNLQKNDPRIGVIRNKSNRGILYNLIELKDIDKIILVEKRCNMRKAGISLKECLNEELKKDPEFKKEWEALQPHLNQMRAILDAREKSKKTQKELSDLTGIDQGDISKLERGLSNPTIKSLQKIADALDMELSIKFIPKK